MKLRCPSSMQDHVWNWIPAALRCIKLVSLSLYSVEVLLQHGYHRAERNGAGKPALQIRLERLASRSCSERSDTIRRIRASSKSKQQNADS